MLKTFAVLVSACVLGLASAAPPTVPETVKGDVGQMVRVEVAGGDDIGFQAAWADDPKVTFDELSARGGKRRFFVHAMKPGIYPIVFWSKGETVGATCVVVIGGAVPVPPGPGPGPTPNPNPPGPVAPQKLWVVIVEESGEAVAGRGAWFLDSALAGRMKEKGHKFRVIDKDATTATGETPADVKRFIDDAKSKPLPRVYLVGEKGETVAADAVPTTAAGLLEFITAHGG